jgi:hypothetical protein
MSVPGVTNKTIMLNDVMLSVVAPFLQQEAIMVINSFTVVSQCANFLKFT